MSEPTWDIVEYQGVHSVAIWTCHGCGHARWFIGRPNEHFEPCEVCPKIAAAEEMRDLLWRLLEYGREGVDQYEDWIVAERDARALLARLEAKP